MQNLWYIVVLIRIVIVIEWIGLIRDFDVEMYALFLSLFSLSWNRPASKNRR